MRSTSLPLASQVRLLSGGDFWHTEALPEVDLPSVLLTDGPHGVRAQTGTSDTFDLADTAPATCFPTAVTLGSTWDEALCEEVGRALGAEARALGVRVLLGPGLNLKRHPLGGRCFEYLSEDPLISGRLAGAMVRGIQHHGVGACLKHFVANSQETRRFVVDTLVDERTLRELYLAGFEEAVRSGRPHAVMAAYNQLNGTPCSQHRWLLTTVLREEWGFDGLVMSDWGATVDRVAAVHAGLDLEMPGSGGAFDTDLAAALHDGALDAEEVATACQRVIDLVTSRPSDPAPAGSEEDHHALARRAAAAGTVLLTNDGILPLPASEVGTIALIGAFAEAPRYQGSGSSRVRPTRLATAREAVGSRGCDVRYAPGYDPLTSEPDTRRIAEAVEVARTADVVVLVVGLPGAFETEGVDRGDLSLPQQHDELVAAVCDANPRTVVVLRNGSPVLLPWADRPAAIVEGYLGGQAGGEALADVLFGDAEPGGRLAESFPAARSDIAADPWFPGDGRRVQHREGLFVGYRHHTTAGVAPRFPFGHGLSYATFAWGEPTLDRTALAVGPELGVTVDVEVTNTGDRAGSDVVQLYVHDRSGVVLRPRRELRAFAKVHLAPGETTTVHLELGPRAFAFWDVGRDRWSIPAGAFDLEVARSSASHDVVHVVSIEVSGGVTSSSEPADTAPVAATDAAFAKRLGRPIPGAAPGRPFTRRSTVEEIEATPLGRVIAASLRRGMPLSPETLEDPGMRRAVERGLAEMPLQGLALFSRGQLGLGTIDIVVDLLNGAPGAAALRAWRSLRRRVSP